MMQSCLDQLFVLDSREIGDNKLNAFLPYRKGAKEFDYQLVGCRVLSVLMGKKVKKSFSLDKYRTRCSDILEGKLSDPSVLEDLQKMYFGDGNIQATAPEFLLLKANEKGNASSKHLAGVFLSLVSACTTKLRLESSTSFIESILLSALEDSLTSERHAESEQCYLPFVAECFLHDIKFLSGHSDYFLEQLSAVMELYTFIYCSQLGLSIHNWADGASPESQPLYFILDTEKASRERSKLVHHGYRALAGKMSDVFPMLSILEHFNNDKDQKRQPLWVFANSLNEATDDERKRAKEALKDFSERFRQKRKLESLPTPAKDAIDAMRHVLFYGTRQFRKDVNSGRHRVQQQYMEVFQKEVAGSFLQSRGRSGRVLVINQDYLLLLTNLSIGDRESLRFQELLSEFQKRGFYFDKGSQQALINFFERVGNVDRMSDSGDAVYVRSTV